jgi:AAA-like domain/TIR domain
MSSEPLTTKIASIMAGDSDRPMPTLEKPCNEENNSDPSLLNLGRTIDFEHSSESTAPLSFRVGKNSPRKSTRIFISYRSQDPDLSLAQQFYKALTVAGHQTFMAGECIGLGENWPHRVDTELEHAEYFLLLLSPQSAASEMVTEEVRRARELRARHPEHKPNILPIRINFPWDSSLNYDLRGYLTRIQQREWKSPSDTAKILQEILDLLTGSEQPEPLIPQLTTSSEEPEPDSPPPISQSPAPNDNPPLPIAEPELPGGQVDIASLFYMERPPIEANCYEAIAKPGGLIRIKAPRQMGKTSLLSRLLRHAQELDYLVVSLSFQIADTSTFTDLNRFLRWFCASVGRKLRLPNRLADYWDEIFGSKDNCTAYFEEYLLTEISRPLTLGLDEVDCVFQHPEIAADFFGLLRAWHEDSKSRDLWKKLRLVVVHSTEVYIPLDINQSPFNVGLPIELLEFTPEQVQDLAQRHGLNWGLGNVQQLMNTVGGHPYLVRLALYHITRGNINLNHLLQTAPTEAGLYNDHLRRHLWNLEQRPELAKALKKVITSDAPVRLGSMQAFQLHSMGLVHLHGNDVIPRCDLYRQYFCERLQSGNR